MHEQSLNVQGTVLWYAAAVVNNPGNYAKLLQNNYWRYPALQPLMPFIDDKAPKKPRSLKVSWSDDGCLLHWKAPKGKGWENEAYKYVVYRFGPDEEIDLDNPTKIVAITYQPAIRLNYNGGETKYTYVVTALDRMSNESVGKKKKIRL